jgi:hypothetical protein
MASALWENTSATLTQFKPIVAEVVEHIPQGVIIGTGILGLFTLSISTLVLFLFFIELTAVNGLLVKSFAHLFPTVIGASGFPNFPLFFVTGVLTYLNASIVSFSDIFQRIGGEYLTKQSTAVTTSCLAILLMFVYTVVTGKSDMLPAFMTVLFAALIAVVLFFIHLILFGKEGINLLGVPILTSKTGGGKPIYACGPAL